MIIVGILTTFTLIVSTAIFILIANRMYKRRFKGKVVVKNGELRIE